MTIPYLRLMFLVFPMLLVHPADAKDPDYRGTLDILRGDEAATLASGTVFEDENRNARLDADEKGIPGVLVSNGREVVRFEVVETLPPLDWRFGKNFE